MPPVSPCIDISDMGNAALHTKTAPSSSGDQVTSEQHSHATQPMLRPWADQDVSYPWPLGVHNHKQEERGVSKKNGHQQSCWSLTAETCNKKSKNRQDVYHVQTGILLPARTHILLRIPPAFSDLYNPWRQVSPSMMHAEQIRTLLFMSRPLQVSSLPQGFLPYHSHKESKATEPLGKDTEATHLSTVIPLDPFYFCS